MRFRHLPVKSFEDTTQDLEQLQAILTAIASVQTPAESTKANTEAITSILEVLRGK